MTEQEMVNEINARVAALNSLMREASNLNLEVDIDYIQYRPFESKVPVNIFSAAITKRLS